MQYQDVDPALVVAGDQVGVLIVEALQAADVPARAAHQVHPAFVEADPGFVGVAHQPAREALGEGERQYLDERHAEQERAEQNRVQCQ
ncbi:hypothetical protein D3C80_1728980 [compost metagenome]